MKQTWMCMILFLILTSANAQVQKSREKQSGSKSAVSPAPVSQAPESIILTSESSYNAFDVAEAEQLSLRISDPFIVIMNNRAKGIDPPVKNVELLGMPKGAYGFANGKLRVFPVSTTSHGGLTGMGTVATGSSTGTMGSIGLSHANGKSTYAGNGMWGNALGLDLVSSQRSRQGNR